MRQTRVEENHLFSSTNKKGKDIKKHAYIQMILAKQAQNISQARTMHVIVAKHAKLETTLWLWVLPLIISVKQ